MTPNLNIYLDIILELEQYLPYMTPEEQHQYEQAVIHKEMPVFTENTIDKWKKDKDIHDKAINAKFTAAKRKSDASCKRKAKG